jgi:membrane protein DedA with SNARE-associated domain
LTLVGSAIWCFAFAAAGWALGGSWKSFHHGFGYVDIVFVAASVAAIGLFALRRVRSSARRRQAPPRAGSDRTDTDPSLPD